MAEPGMKCRSCQKNLKRFDMAKTLGLSQVTDLRQVWNSSATGTQKSDITIVADSKEILAPYCWFMKSKL